MIQIHKVSKEDWASLADNAHLAIFGEKKPASQERIDFALLAVNGDDLIGYVTCRELSPTILYWSYGGAFPPGSKTLYAWLGYRAMTETCKKLGYEEILTFIENKNSPMLKMASKIGYFISGLRMWNGHTMLEHTLELKNAH